MKNEELNVLKGIAICFKPFLKPEEAMIYCNLAHSQMAKKLSEFGIRKTGSGYYRKEDLDLMMAGRKHPTITIRKGIQPDNFLITEKKDNNL